jgi:hypothetical protein
MNEAEKRVGSIPPVLAGWIETSAEFLKVIRGLSSERWQYLLTRDEQQLFHTTDHVILWLSWNDELTMRPKKLASSPSTTDINSWSPDDFNVIEALSKTKLTGK